MNKIIDRIYNRTFASEQDITEEVIDFYEKNPDELDLIIEQEDFQSTFLGLFFILGLVISITARTIQIVYAKHLSEFVKVVVLDLASEIGIAIFGGTLAAYFLEFLRHKQFQNNKNFREKVQQKLKERQSNKKPQQ